MELDGRQLTAEEVNDWLRSALRRIADGDWNRVRRGDGAYQTVALGEFKTVHEFARDALKAVEPRP